MEDRLLPATEASRLLGISKRRCWLLARRGLIPSVKMGDRQVRFSAARLQELIAKGGVSVTPGEQGSGRAAVGQPMSISESATPVVSVRRAMR